MRPAALLDELLQLAAKRGLTVRRESMTRGVGSGGYCVLRGQPTVFVDDRASVEVQVEVLVAALRRLDWSDVFVHPGVRAVLGLDANGQAATAD